MHRESPRREPSILLPLDLCNDPYSAPKSLDFGNLESLPPVPSSRVRVFSKARFTNEIAGIDLLSARWQRRHRAWARPGPSSILSCGAKAGFGSGVRSD